MSSRSRAIVLRPRDPPSSQLLAAELRLAGLLHEVAGLEAEVGALTRELAEFEARYLDATGQAFADLDRAERLVRRVRRVVDEVERLHRTYRNGPPPPAPRARGAARSGGSRRAPEAGRAERVSGPPPPRPGPAFGGALESGFAHEPDDLHLRGLHRRLARLLHPDLVRGDDAERARRSDLMARANEAYERGDRAALELLAEQVGAIRCECDLSEADRLVHLAGRIAAVETARARLSAERARLSASAAARLLAEAPRRAKSGGDLLAEARAGAEAEARAARRRALELLGELAGEARSLGRTRRNLLAGVPLDRRGRRAWDPLLESPLLRHGAARADWGRAAARRLALALEKQAQGKAPWEAALTLLAFLGEVEGTPPEALASWELLVERWDSLRAGWSGAPDLAGALSRLPPHLEIGLRAWGDEVEAGPQLASPELAAGVRAALRHEAVRELAQRVFASLGPRERCRCGDVYAVHVLRLRGLDEVHGLACPRCSAVLKSFWRYGEPRGLEALSRLALDIGLVVEQPVRLAGALLAFQMLPAERNRLTARALLRRFRELCLGPHGLELPRGALALRAGRAPLADGARVPEGTRVFVVVKPDAGLGARELLALLRRKVERRFRA
jgi:hypothetical protein